MIVSYHSEARFSLADRNGIMLSSERLGVDTCILIVCRCQKAKIEVWILNCWVSQIRADAIDLEHVAS